MAGAPEVPPSSPAAAPVVQRVQLATSEPDLAQELMQQLFGTRLHVGAPEDEDWVLRIDGHDTGRSSSVESVLPAQLRYTVGGHGPDEDFVIVSVSGGRVAFDRREPAHRAARTDRYLAGDVYVGNQPHELAAVRTEHARARAITLPRRVVADAAADAGSGPRVDRSGTAPLPSSTTMAPDGPGGARRWRQATRHVDDVLSDPVAASAPLLVAALGRLLAGTALTVFPNTLTTTGTAQDRRDAHPQALRRAVAFVEANPDVDLTTADIARAAFVSPRTVQLAFRRHLGTTPLAYLRTVRLEQAHRQLQVCLPADGRLAGGQGTDGRRTTVAQVAARWGFTPSRFTEHYRAVYGVAPSRTLRS